LAADAGATINVNTADSLTLMCLLRDSVVVRAVLGVRRARSGEALARLLAAHLQAGPEIRTDLAAWGTGQVNVNTASARVLGCLAGVGDHGGAQIAAARRRVGGFNSLEEMVQLLPPSMRSGLDTAFGAFTRVAVTTPPSIVIVASGVAGARGLKSTVTLFTVLGNPHLVVLGRESE